MALLLVGLGFFGGWAAAVRWGGSRQADDAAGSPGRLWTCGMHPRVIQTKPGICPICHMKLTPLDARASKGGSNIVAIDPVVVQNMGLRVAEATRGALAMTIRAAGTIEEAEPARRDFTLKVGGWVERLLADTEGMHVRKGDPLLEVYSPQLLTAQEELIAARRALEALPPEAGAALRQDAELLLESAKEKLLLWGLAPEEVEAMSREKRARTRVVFRSPANGHLIEKLVVEGSSVEPGQKLFRIVDHTVLWLNARIYERHMPFVSLGQSARARVAAFPGKNWQGSVQFIHPHIDEATRAATARLVIENPGLELKPGMYAVVEIKSRRPEETVLAPRSAVIDTGVRQIAFVAREKGHFERRQLRIGAENEEDLVEVLEGLSAGEKVVVSGQFLLDAESRTPEITRKLDSEGLLEKAPAAPGSPASPPGPGDRRGPGQPVDEVLARYLELSRALASDDRAIARSAAEAMASAAAAFRERSAGGPLEGQAEKVLRAARALSDRPLEEARKLFKPLSDVVIDLVSREPPSPEMARKLYVIHCPMFPGDWLQTDQKVANPFYGPSMLECGEVVRTIEPRTGQSRAGDAPAREPEKGR